MDIALFYINSEKKKKKEVSSIALIITDCNR